MERYYNVVSRLQLTGGFLRETKCEICPTFEDQCSVVDNLVTREAPLPPSAG